MCSISAVVFDMDGVIFDTERQGWQRAWAEVAPHYGAYNVERFFAQMMGASAEDISKLFFKEYGDKFPFADYHRDVKNRVIEITETEGLKFKDGAEEILHYLKQRGIPTALATSTVRPTAEKFLKRMKIYDCFDKIMTGDAITHCKPDPEIYLKAADALGIATKKCVAVEDSFNGIRSACRAKMKPIMVPDTVQPTEEIEKLLFRKFSSLTETLDFFKSCGM